MKTLLTSVDSKVEVRLQKNWEGSIWYHLEYRFVDIEISYKFLFFKWTREHKNSDWRAVVLYKKPIEINLSSIGNPDDNIHWHQVSYRADQFKELEEYLKIKEKIKVYADLDREFEISKREEQYKKDLEKYNQILSLAKEMAKKL
jgi:hypothetical protein